jgi:hypothetical protein
LEDPSYLPYPLSKPCGSLKTNTTNPEFQSSTENVSEEISYICLQLYFFIFIFKSKIKTIKTTLFNFLCLYQTKLFLITYNSTIDYSALFFRLNYNFIINLIQVYKII